MRDTATAAREATRLAEALLQEAGAGRKVALARAISIVENQRAGYRELLHVLHARVGNAHRVGITGPPGAGKSTLVAALVRHYRGLGERVAVIAVDPTSPFTGGALLGDRIRMGEIALDPDVFFRSMATRGSLGGLAVSTEEVCDVIDAFGFDRILIETVGVGQTELDIASTADSTIVVLVPESGDGIQAMKAGLMEVADLIVVNKADRPGADRLMREISLALHLRSGRTSRNVPAHHGVDLTRVSTPPSPPPAISPSPSPSPSPSLRERQRELPVLRTVAVTGEGLAELADAIEQHGSWLDESGERLERRRRRMAERVRQEVDRAARKKVWTASSEAMLEEATSDLARGQSSPYEVASRIVAQAFGSPAAGPRPESDRIDGGTGNGSDGVGEAADTTDAGL